MAYTAVYVIGDSLVEVGNALKLAEFVDDLPFSALPDGAPTSELGYYDGRFTNGFNFADLVSNKFISVPTTTVFPFGFSDPFLGISFPFASDPEGNNLNFAYGGAKIRKGGEAVPDLDDQTDAFKDAVDGDADPNALMLVTIGGNDVRSLVPVSGSIASAVTAQSRLTNAAQEFHEEMEDLIDAGLRHIVVTGIPNVGIIPGYNDLPDEDARRAAAETYSALLDGMIFQYVLQLRAEHPGVTIHYVSLVDAAASVLDKLDQIFAAEELAALNNPSDILFFDHVHPTAQAHALIAAYILDTMSGSPAGETLALLSPDYQLEGNVAGEVDRITISLAANRSYTFELLGISSGNGSLPDPSLRILSPAGLVVGANDDGGLGLDAVVHFTAAQAGDYVVELAGVGSLSGSYRFQATGETAGDDTYVVSHPSALILEQPGDGYDTVLASVSYTLASGLSIEKLATTSAAGKASINLTGNGLDQSIFGNAGSNILDGKGGSDSLWGGAGKDMFAFTSPPNGGIDVIDDFNVRDDTIYLDDAIFTGLAPGALGKAVFVAGTAAKDSSDRIIFDQASGSLYFDPDGTGPNAQVHFASLDAGLRITASDFYII